MADLERDRTIITAVRQMQSDGFIQSGKIPPNWLERGPGFLSAACKNLEVLFKGISRTHRDVSPQQEFSRTYREVDGELILECPRLEVRIGLPPQAQDILSEK